MKTSITAVLLSCAMLAPLAARADSRADHQTEDSIKASYTFHTILDGKVKVDVNDGVAKLTGKVQDEEQSRVAEDTAASFPGVNSVINKIKVEGVDKPGSDEWIATKVRSRLLVKANVSLTNTKVDVRGGMVYLTGTATSQAQKDLTEAYAKDIDGVKSVTNNITVVEKGDKSYRDDDMNRPTASDKMDDSSITAQIKYELFSHRSTSALKTKVNTINGNVVISGDASSDAEKDLVTKLAKSVRGVQSVDNNMMVRR
jgi:hyperosmotically inducible protein